MFVHIRYRTQSLSIAETINQNIFIAKEMIYKLYFYRSFDFEIELKSGSVHTFSSIEKGEYDKLFDYITSKKLHVKNTGKNVSFIFQLILLYFLKLH